MNVLPQEILQTPGEHARFIEQTVWPSLDFARIHLIKDKDGIDDYLAKNIKGLSKQEAAANRNSYKKNICIDMLRQGYHESFSKLLALIQKWNALREAAGPGSAIWQQKSLEEQPDKLDQLYHFLTRAEAAQRAGHYEEVYDNQLNLACCFNDLEDKWLSNYFYKQCFNTAQLIKIDGGKREAQAHADMGLINEEQGHVMKAAEHYEAFYQLTEGSTWKDETGHTYNSLACEHLWRIYTLLADKMLENKEYRQAIKTLTKALKMAKEGGDMKMEGEAVYCLSLAYHFAGEQQTALSILDTSVKIFTACCDSAGLGRAYAAIAKILVSQGKAPEAIKYLGDFMKTAENAHLSQSLVDACVLLGNIYNERGNYNEAFEYFTQASEAAKTLNNLPLVDETKAYCGIAKAHKLMVAFNSHIEAEDPVSLKYLLAWKENRSGMCTDPFTVGVRLARVPAGLARSGPPTRRFPPPLCRPPAPRLLKRPPPPRRLRGSPARGGGGGQGGISPPLPTPGGGPGGVRSSSGCAVGGARRGARAPRKDSATRPKRLGRRQAALRARGIARYRCASNDGNDSGKRWPGRGGPGGGPACAGRGERGAASAPFRACGAAAPAVPAGRHPRSARAALKMKLEPVAGRKYEYLIAARV
ncbi:tetratricopeptide repeat protein 29 [Ciconia boyciana]|uniref:tetratricopeptide repeat protein 29 n=1 Tax=Ciconia boyciana TaxID=52775 RepID=UPI003BA113B5